ncbi:DnaT-like ssDNA-binding domain-containing protein [Pseudomonas sp. WMBT8]|uniref:DnaT-like ssDNA-binding domain-containing protein n=1 Tax=Pseudomonas sp. WMBT8 TaxID=3414496 RepID=UPI003D806D0E
MARIRTVKPEFWSSEQVMSCTPLARLLFIGIWNFCDDGGNHPLSPRTIKALVFPGDDITVESVDGLLGELKSSNLIALYSVESKTYLHVRGWRHQKIDKRTFKYPAFIGGPDQSSPSGSRVLDEESSNGSRVLPPGREGEGNGRDQHHSLNAGEEIQGSGFEGFDDLEDLPLEDDEPPVDPKAPVEMTLDWMPDANLLKTYCIHFGVSTDLFTKEAVAPFTAHHETTGLLQTQTKWVSLLVKWVKDDKNRASNVRPFVKREVSSRHTGFSERDYTAGLIQREDGTYAF